MHTHNLGSSHRTTIEGEYWLRQVVLWPPQVLYGMHTHLPSHQINQYISVISNDIVLESLCESSAWTSLLLFFISSWKIFYSIFCLYSLLPPTPLRSSPLPYLPKFAFYFIYLFIFYSASPISTDHIFLNEWSSLESGWAGAKLLQKTGFSSPSSYQLLIALYYCWNQRPPPHPWCLT